MNNDNNNNSDNSHFQAPFWDWVRSMEDYQQSRPRPGHSNAGPQFPSGFPFDAAGLGPWHENWAGPRGQGRRGPHRHHHPGNGHHGAEDQEPRVEEATDTDTETMTKEKESPEEHGTHPPPPPPPPQEPQGTFHPPPPPPPPPHSHGRHPHGPPPPFGGPRGRGGRRAYLSSCSRGGRGHHHPPSPPQFEGPFDFRPILRTLSRHPLARTWRDYAATANHAPQQEEGQTDVEQQQDFVFTPPVDIFNDETAYVLHVALPNVAKEDIDVNWDGDKLNITGVASRPGSAEFLGTLVSSEINVGIFERKIKLPPPGSSDSEDVDGYGITAKMESGILVVTVPKLEKDWTEVHKVEIE